MGQPETESRNQLTDVSASAATVISIGFLSRPNRMSSTGSARQEIIAGKAH